MRGFGVFPGYLSTTNIRCIVAASRRGSAISPTPRRVCSVFERVVRLAPSAPPAIARAGAKRAHRQFGAASAVLRAEAIGVELVRLVPQRRAALDQIG